MIWILPMIYVLVHSPSEADGVRSYDGQSQATITSLLAAEGKTGDFITKQQYDSFIAAIQKPTEAELLATLRNLAVQEWSSGNEPSNKVERAAFLAVLDELNILRQRDRDRSADVAAATSLADLKTRWAARSALNDRTVSQAKQAVQDKINSGSGD